MAYLPTSVGNVAASPAAGGTVSANANGANQVIYLTPSGTLATLTVNLPADAVSIIGQLITLSCSQIVTIITVAAPNASILNNISAFTANGVVVYQKVAAGVWAKLSAI